MDPPFNISPIIDVIKKVQKTSLISILKYNLIINYMNKRLFLIVAKHRAKEAGYDPDKLTLASDGTHKLVYDGVPFGNINYNDYIQYSYLESEGKMTAREVDDHRRRYLARATKIKGDWRRNKISPNNLAIHILW
jgi:hypothetical protein